MLSVLWEMVSQDHVLFNVWVNKAILGHLPTAKFLVWANDGVFGHLPT